jgi:hypothetical protein
MPDVKRGAVKRRTLVTGTAWAIPVITVAQAAPAFALSPTFITGTGQAAKLQGNSCCGGDKNCQYFKQGYRYYFRVVNNTPNDLCFDVKTFKVDGVVVSEHQVWLPDNTVTTGCCGKTAKHSFRVAAGDTIVIAIDADLDRSPNTNVQITYDVFKSATCAALATNQETTVFVGTPPTQGNCAPF